MQAGAEADVKSEDWGNAARSYGNLSELHLSLGDIEEVITARPGNRSISPTAAGNGFLRMSTRANPRRRPPSIR